MRGNSAVRAIVAFLIFQVVGVLLFGYEQFFQTEIIGLSNGLIFALVALGYTLVYGIIELINFAHGDVFMLGSMFAFLLIGPIFGVTGDTPVYLKIGIVLFVLGVVMLGDGGAQRHDRAGGLQAAAERPRSWHPDLRHRRELRPPERRAAAGRPGQQEHRQHLRDVQPPPRRSGSPGSPSTSSSCSSDRDDPSADRAVVVRADDEAGQGHASHRPGPRHGGPDGRRRQPDDRDHVPDRRGTGRRGGRRPDPLQQHHVWNLGFRFGLNSFTAAVLGGIGNLQGAVLGAIVLGFINAFSDRTSRPTGRTRSCSAC